MTPAERRAALARLAAEEAAEDHDHWDAAAPVPEDDSWEARRREILALGLPDDGYDYLQHLRTITSDQTTVGPTPFHDDNEHREHHHDQPTPSPNSKETDKIWIDGDGPSTTPKDWNRAKYQDRGGGGAAVFMPSLVQPERMEDEEWYNATRFRVTELLPVGTEAEEEALRADTASVPRSRDVGALVRKVSFLGREVGVASASAGIGPLVGPSSGPAEGPRAKSSAARVRAELRRAEVALLEQEKQALAAGADAKVTAPVVESTMGEEEDGDWFDSFLLAASRETRGGRGTKNTTSAGGEEEEDGDEGPDAEATEDNSDSEYEEWSSVDMGSMDVRGVGTDDDVDDEEGGGGGDDRSRAPRRRHMPFDAASVASSAWMKAPRDDRPEQLELIDERFEAMVMKEYAEEAMGDLSSDEEETRGLGGGTGSNTTTSLEHYAGVLDAFLEGRDGGQAKTKAKGASKGADKVAYISASDWFAQQEEKERAAKAQREAVRWSRPETHGSALTPTITNTNTNTTVATLDNIQGDVEAILASNREAAEAKAAEIAAVAHTRTHALAQALVEAAAGEEPKSDKEVARELLGSGYMKPTARSQWDCESVLSMRSNLDNHPGTLDEPKRGRRRGMGGRVAGASSHGDLEGSNPSTISTKGPIVLSEKTGLPVGYVGLTGLRGIAEGDEEMDGSEDGEGAGAGDEVEERGTVMRPRGESKEEKKVRKAAAKEAQREARERKRSLKNAYKEAEKEVKKQSGRAGLGVSSMRL